MSDLGIWLISGLLATYPILCFARIIVITLRYKPEPDWKAIADFLYDACREDSPQAMRDEARRNYEEAINAERHS